MLQKTHCIDKFKYKENHDSRFWNGNCIKAISDSPYNRGVFFLLFRKERNVDLPNVHLSDDVRKL